MQVRDMRKPGWAWCKNELIREHGSEIGPYGIATYMALASYSGKNETAKPSIRTIARTIGASKSSVKRALTTLEELDWVKVRRRKDGKQNKSNIYYLLPSPLEGESSEKGGGSSQNRGVGSERTGGGFSENRKEEPIEEEPLEQDADERARAREDTSNNLTDFSFLPKQDRENHLDDILDTVNALQVRDKLDFVDLKRATIGGLGMNRSQRRALARFADDHAPAECIAAATIAAKKGMPLSAMDAVAEQWAKAAENSNPWDYELQWYG